MNKVLYKKSKYQRNSRFSNLNSKKKCKNAKGISFSPKNRLYMTKTWTFCSFNTATNIGRVLAKRHTVFSDFRLKNNDELRNVTFVGRWPSESGDVADYRRLLSAFENEQNKFGEILQILDDNVFNTNLLQLAILLTLLLNFT